MCQGTYRDEIHTLLGIVADGIVGDTARRLSLILASDDIHRLLGIRHREIVEHDTVYTTVLQNLVEFLEAAHLDFNLQVEPLLLEVSMATVDSIVDTTSEVDMVVLEQDHIEETDAMVHTATDLHSLLLQHSETWSSLAGVQDMSLGTLKALHVLSGHGSDTAHTLHDVEHQALCLEE